MYSEDEENSYTMWWSYGANPNDAVTDRLHGNVTEMCHLE